MIKNFLQRLIGNLAPTVFKPTSGGLLYILLQAVEREIAGECPWSTGEECLKGYTDSYWSDPIVGGPKCRNIECPQYVHPWGLIAYTSRSSEDSSVDNRFDYSSFRYLSGNGDDWIPVGTLGVKVKFDFGFLADPGGYGALAYGYGQYGYNPILPGGKKVAIGDKWTIICVAETGLIGPAIPDPTNKGSYGPISTNTKGVAGPTVINVIGSLGKYTRISGSFILERFAVGDKITVTGYSNVGNNGVKYIKEVSALEITVTNNTGMVIESGTGDERIVAAGAYAGDHNTTYTLEVIDFWGYNQNFQNALLQISLATCTDEWLDYWGEYFGISRLLLSSGSSSYYEDDETYRARIMKEITRAKGTRAILLEEAEAYFNSDLVTISEYHQIGAPSVVVGTDGLYYVCILNHVSSSLNKPITGANWSTYWKQGGLAGNSWVSGFSYTVGSALKWDGPVIAAGDPAKGLWPWQFYINAPVSKSPSAKYIKTADVVSCKCDVSCYGYEPCFCDSASYNATPCTCDLLCYGQASCSCDATCHIYTHGCSCDGSCYGYAGCSCNATCYQQSCTCYNLGYQLSWCKAEGAWICTCNLTCYGQGCTCNVACHGYNPCTCDGTCYGELDTCSCNLTCYGYSPCSCNAGCYEEATCECDGVSYGASACSCDFTCYAEYISPSFLVPYPPAKVYTYEGGYGYYYGYGSFIPYVYGTSLFSAPTNVGDAILFGNTYQFSGVKFSFATPGIGGSYAWEYWNGSEWVGLTIKDTTGGLTSSNFVHWFEGLKSWEKADDVPYNIPNTGTKLFWVRCRVTGIPVTNPIASGIWLTYAGLTCRGTYCARGTKGCFCDNTCYGYQSCTCNLQMYGGRPCICDMTCYQHHDCDCDATCYPYIGCSCDVTCYGYVGCSCNLACYAHQACVCNMLSYDLHYSCKGELTCTCDRMCYGYHGCDCNATCYGYVGCSCDSKCYGYGSCTCDSMCYAFSACSCEGTCYAFVPCLCDITTYGYSGCICNLACYSETAATYNAANRDKNNCYIYFEATYAKPSWESGLQDIVDRLKVAGTAAIINPVEE